MMTLLDARKKIGLQKVLVVDDQPDVREALRLLLKDAGYAIETAASPADALAASAGCDYDRRRRLAAAGSVARAAARRAHYRHDWLEHH
jgi:hypothetical protein